MKVGSIVIVKDPSACLNGCNDEMKRFKGKMAKITRYENNGRHIRIDIDNHRWSWCNQSLAMGLPSASMDAEEFVMAANSQELKDLWEQRKELDSKINELIFKHLTSLEEEKANV